MHQKYGSSQKDAGLLSSFFDLIGADTTSLDPNMITSLEKLGYITHSIWEIDADNIIILCNANYGQDSMTTVAYCTLSSFSEDNEGYDLNGL